MLKGGRKKIAKYAAATAAETAAIVVTKIITQTEYTAE